MPSFALARLAVMDERPGDGQNETEHAEHAHEKENEVLALDFFCSLLRRRNRIVGSTTSDGGGGIPFNDNRQRDRHKGSQHPGMSEEGWHHLASSSEVYCRSGSYLAANAYSVTRIVLIVSGGWITNAPQQLSRPAVL